MMIMLSGVTAIKGLRQVYRRAGITRQSWRFIFVWFIGSYFF
jgi:hypothetical protein